MKAIFRPFLLALLSGCIFSATGQEENITDLTEVPLKDSSEIKKEKKNKDLSIMGFPIFTYTPETSAGFGASCVSSYHFKNDTARSFPSFTSLYSYYTLKKQFKVELFGNFFWHGNKNFVDYEMGFYRYVYPYFGVGNNLPKDNEEWYGANSQKLWAVYQRRLYKTILLGPRWSIENYHLTHVEDLRQLDTTRPVGFKGGLTNGIGFLFTYDKRDDPMFPWKGTYLGLQGMFYMPFLSSDYTFQHFTLDYRSYLNIKHKVIIASQVIWQGYTGTVPFYNQALYGSKTYMRGYIEGRGRDRFLFMTQGEIRYPFLKNRLVATGFLASGRTGHTIGDLFKVKDYAFALGFGMRFRFFKNSNLSARIDFAFFKQTNGLYVVVNEAF